MSAVLEVSDVTVRFGGVAAVDDVSLTVNAGEVVGLIGPNGAGKTVLFNVITGLQQPQHGTVRIRGVDVSDAAAADRVQLGLARTFQMVQLFAGMSVEQNLAVAAHHFTRSSLIADALGLPSRHRSLRAAQARATAVLDFLDLQPLAQLDVGSLPIGQARMVELARALCLKPRLLLLDEAASGLDSAETDQFVAQVRRIRELLGCAVLLVEHDMSVVSRLCDHVVVMNAGTVLSEGLADTVRADPQVRQAYLGEPA